MRALLLIIVRLDFASVLQDTRGVRPSSGASRFQAAARPTTTAASATPSSRELAGALKPISATLCLRFARRATIALPDNALARPASPGALKA